MTGSAGCKENHDEFGPLEDISAFRANDYGYTRMKVINNTHLYLEQVSDDRVNFNSIKRIYLFGIRLIYSFIFRTEKSLIASI